MILDEDSSAPCYTIIRRLALRYQSVPFTPHITLSATPDEPQNRIQEKLNILASETSSFVLEAETIRCSSSPYQKLTHGIKITSELQILHRKTDRLFGGDFAKKEYPHISYLYSTLDCSQLSHEIVEIEKEALKKIEVDQIALVQCKGTPDDWKMLATWNLG